MKTILIIEPNTLLAQTYTQALSQQGYRAESAPGAQQAIHAADEHAPDIVVMELQLAGHSGIEFLHEFRSYAEWQEVPVIVNTFLPPDTIEPLKLSFSELKVRTFLYKPQTSLSMLIREVQRQLDGAI